MVKLTICSVVIFSHTCRYLDSDCINFKTFVFLAVYWSIWTSSYNTDIKVQQFFFNGASTMLNNFFNKLNVSFTTEWKKEEWSFLLGFESRCFVQDNIALTTQPQTPLWARSYMFSVHNPGKMFSEHVLGTRAFILRALWNVLGTHSFRLKMARISVCAVWRIVYTLRNVWGHFDVHSPCW